MGFDFAETSCVLCLWLDLVHIQKGAIQFIQEQFQNSPKAASQDIVQRGTASHGASLQVCQNE
jgi:hypothetical protein